MDQYNVKGNSTARKRIGGKKNRTYSGGNFSRDTPSACENDQKQSKLSKKRTPSSSALDHSENFFKSNRKQSDSKEVKIKKIGHCPECQTTFQLDKPIETFPVNQALLSLTNASKLPVMNNRMSARNRQITPLKF